MFLDMSVILFTEGGVHPLGKHPHPRADTPLGRHTIPSPKTPPLGREPTPWVEPLPPGDGHCSGQ